MPPDLIQHGTHDALLVAASVGIAVLAAGAALDLAGRVTAARGPTRALWLTGGAAAMGLGIWSMHFIGMLAYQLPVPVFYHVPTVAVSLGAAVLGAGVALSLVSGARLDRKPFVLGSLAMGAAIATMHYVGMAAMRVEALANYHPGLVALSVLIAIAVSGVALTLTFRLRDEVEFWSAHRPAAALLMGVAVAAMHYTGMAAVRFAPSEIHASLAQTVTVSALGWGAVVGSTTLVLAIAIVTSGVDRRFAAQAAALQSARDEVTVLQGLLPICASCKNIRDDSGNWHQIESYVRAHSEAEFSHGICPACEQRLYPELADDSLGSRGI